MKNTSLNIYKTLRWRYFIAIIQMAKMRLRELRNLLKITSSAWIWSQMELQSFCPWELQIIPSIYNTGMSWNVLISISTDHFEYQWFGASTRRSVLLTAGLRNQMTQISCGNSPIYNNEKEQAGDSKCFNKIIVCHITFLVEEQFDTDRSFNIYRNKHTLPPSEICHDLWII